MAVLPAKRSLNQVVKRPELDIRRDQNIAGNVVSALHSTVFVESTCHAAVVIMSDKFQMKPEHFTAFLFFQYIFAKFIREENPLVNNSRIEFFSGLLQKFFIRWQLYSCCIKKGFCLFIYLFSHFFHDLPISFC